MEIRTVSDAVSLVFLATSGSNDEMRKYFELLIPKLVGRDLAASELEIAWYEFLAKIIANPL